ncbi:lipopolysaccharide kinase InaA family protein [Pseudomonas neustonica]|uniref:Heptose kinase n=1 Tax=Pseudomonas neustonica TaxID=2487346 RepID=A0ABX9XQ61_9PSED|nr:MULTISPECIES: lipopolysaccharide kinase InaA family protein [Pseudomonas]MAB24331.1 heptose kinase [Pseudomonadales bacterium]MBA6420447.1 protein kinase [Pseudomonas sp. 5Ae-yellow]ROZ87226.1 heptose kinase [Pseudomonas sp. SSM44]ROZ88157.1 heptose kinase [Pseudomonas neustonica]|tara:strand:+ start:1660 stop:2406 length:747 start_codon:yes stop_codon:yes gene_type:complete
MKRWTLNPEYATGDSGRLFADIDSVFNLEGELITRDPLSSVHKIWVGDRYYYLKRYTGAGKNLRRYIGRSRIQAEWENLLTFQAWGIPSAPVVAFGSERQGGAFLRGALITEDLAGTRDLADLAKNHDPRLDDREWVQHVFRQIANATRMMHDQRFTHNDLKWRNILVDERHRSHVYLIDCPGGSFWWGPMLQYRIIKDLACLDKLGKRYLRRSQRLAFFKAYLGKSVLDDADKKKARAIAAFFEGRE